MIYEQFLYEVAIDFNSLYSDFENQLLNTDELNFDDYFKETTTNEELMGEILKEARQFGMSKEQFLNDLYKNVKNFNGQIETRINQIDMGIKEGRFSNNEIFQAKLTQNRLTQSLA